MLKVVLKVIDHSSQRYDTCGDWQFIPPNQLLVTVSRLGDWRMEMLIALHELVECFTCEIEGVTQKVVDTFDKAWEGKDEPGDNPFSPYHSQHVFATELERRLAHRWGVDWDQYEKRINSLVWRSKDGKRGKNAKRQVESVGGERRNISKRGRERKAVSDGRNRASRGGKSKAMPDGRK